VRHAHELNGDLGLGSWPIRAWMYRGQVVETIYLAIKWDRYVHTKQNKYQGHESGHARNRVDL
jgi:hypothetical protein